MMAGSKGFLLLFFLVLISASSLISTSVEATSRNLLQQGGSRYLTPRAGDPRNPYRRRRGRPYASGCLGVPYCRGNPRN